MEAIKIKTHINSDTIHLSVPKNIVGKEAEIIILVESDDLKLKKRVPGTAKGLITMADDFEAPLDELAKKNIIDFFKESPLFGVELELERNKDLPRTVEL